MNPKFTQTCRHLASIALLAFCAALPLATVAAVTPLADAPLASGVSSSTAVKPNIAFVFDDSGSMDEENMPDGDNENRSNRCFGSHKYNTLFYNPAYTYKPPFKIDGAVYSDGVTRFPDASFSAALKDGYFPSGGRTFTGASGSNTTVNLGTLSNLTPNAVTCSTSDGSSASAATATLTVSGSTSNSNKTSLTSLTVGSTNLLGGATTSSTSTSQTASRIASAITQNGYSASVSGSVVTIKAPASAGAITSTPTFNKTGGLTISVTAFSGYVAASGGECTSSPSKYYYSVHKTDPAYSSCASSTNYNIVTDPNKIEAPNIPNTGRTAAQIAAAKTNYANWYSYYRRRAQLMKAGAGEAFRTLNETKYRIGLFFINSIESGAGSTNNDFKIGDFSGSTSGTQRFDWYTRLYGARGDGSTPLRGALSRMGRMYAGQVSGWDPVQYSCQQNFTILSTDGFWNTGNESSTYGPKQIDGSSNVGNTDGGPAAAQGASATITIGSQSGGSGTDACYRFTSVQVNTGASVLELMNSTPAPSSCTTDRDTLGTAVQNSINNKTSTTQFTASYSSSTDTLTITAPPSLGGITVSPDYTVQKVSGTKSRTFSRTAFTGFSTASSGAPSPYKDTLNVSNTLADVAYYFYQTDLRTDALSNCSNTIGSTAYTSLCTNNVLGSGKDKNEQQHMTTFTLGLGVSGGIRYEPAYETAANDPAVLQYYDVANGASPWPNPSTDAGKIDDLWHAAVNGRGTYYSTSNPQTLQEGIQDALAGVQSRTGSSAAAATSNLEPVAGDNFVYVALYRTVKWDGDLKSFTIDPDSGALSNTEEWSAQAQLNAQVAAATAPSDGRVIKYFNASATNKLKDFTFTNLDADGKGQYFEDICSSGAGVSAMIPRIAQCSDVTFLNDRKTIADDGANLVNYLRGASQHEMRTGNSAANQIYRARDFILGDVVNAVPVYMKKPPFSYDTYDNSYGTFKSSKATRGGTVFIAANDGMLHAVNADTGNERWAYVPSMVMPKMYQLADSNYNHQYYVDGSPTVADVCTTLNATNPQLCESDAYWKTLVIGGLNKGGCGYYALDVTDPATPKGLWEFTNANLGYSYGNPIVAKRKNGQWVVIFTSGYNNYPNNGCGTTGDGNGHVFVVDAATGALLEDIPTYTTGTTPAGTTATPSGLAKLNAWIADATLPIADRVYGGDLLGNVWRVDFDNNHAPSTGTGKEAVRLAQLKDGTASANPQPITTKPELAEVSAGGVSHPVVLVGTGKYLGSSDPTDVSQQSIYALKDKLEATGIADVRGTTMLGRTQVQTVGASGGSLAGRTIRTATGAPINWALSDREGWYLDLNPGNTSPGERVNVDMSLQFNMLTVAANVPEENACNVGGNAYLYFLDYTTGLNLSTATDGMAGIRLSGNALVAGIKTVKLTSGKTVTIVTDTAGNVVSEDNPGSAGASGASARRTTWREIQD